MSSTTEIIDKVLDENSIISKEQKESLREVLIKVFEDGEVPFQAMGVDEDLIEATYAVGYQRFQIGQYKDALEIFDLLYTFNPMDVRFLLGQAASFHQMKKYKEAIEKYLMIVAYDDDTPLPYYYISDCYLNLDEKMAALIYTDMTLRKAFVKPTLYEQIIQRSELARDKLCEELDIDPEMLEGPSVFDELEQMDLKDLGIEEPPKKKKKKKVKRKKQSPPKK